MRLTLMIIFLLGLTTQVTCQIKGNKMMKTITKSITSITSVDIQFNANVLIDYDQTEQISITADENILDYIGLKLTNGTLTIDQKQWIEPSNMPSITIGAPQLRAVYQGTHQSTLIQNVKGETLSLDGNVGDITAEGSVEMLSVKTTGTDMDLSDLEADKATIFIEDDSKVVLGKVTTLEKNLSSRARLIQTSKDDDTKNKVQSNKNERQEELPNLKWIDFQIKNNSWKRNHFVVVGPKKDGSSFSYGFSLFPHSKKAERWSTGTQVYKVTRSGGRELLITISAENEGMMVNLFD